MRSAALRRRGLQQHPELVNAVIEGDSARASAVSVEHFALTERTIRNLYEGVDGTDNPQILRNLKGAPHAGHRR
jgi:DNA-binding FadR family transcriptional regulator